MLASWLKSNSALASRRIGGVSVHVVTAYNLSPCGINHSLLHHLPCYQDNGGLSARWPQDRVQGLWVGQIFLFLEVNLLQQYLTEQFRSKVAASVEGQSGLCGQMVIKPPWLCLLGDRSTECSRHMMQEPSEHHGWRTVFSRLCRRTFVLGNRNESKPIQRRATARCSPSDLLYGINERFPIFHPSASWSWDWLQLTAVDKLFLNSRLCNTSIVRNVGLSPHSTWISPLIATQEHHRALASYTLWHTDKSDDLEDVSEVFLLFVL